MARYLFNSLSYQRSNIRKQVDIEQHVNNPLNLLKLPSQSVRMIVTEVP